jgi:2-dehydropantoate 2-reductase
MASAAGDRQKVAVIGAGGIGGWLAAELEAAGHEVLLCARKPFERLVVRSNGVEREIPVTVATKPDLQSPLPWVFVTTKAHDTAGAASWLSHLTDGATIVVALQNGIDHHARIAPFVGQATILPALSYAAVERIGPGRTVHHKGYQIIVPTGAAGAALARLVAGSRLEIQQEDDFLTAAWRKLLSNLAANPLTALTLQRIGVIHNPDIRELARGVLHEGARVAAAEGARLANGDGDAILDELGGYSRDGGSSMLYDRLAGRPLEHEFLTGAVVRAAERHKIDVPLNRALLALLRALDGAIRSGAVSSRRD